MAILSENLKRRIVHAIADAFYGQELINAIEDSIDSQGIQGIQGPKGDKGDKGDTGDIGPQGPAGISGTVIHKGLYSMNQLNQSVFIVTFPDVGTSNYIVMATIQELSGSHPRHLTPLIIAKTSNSFTFETNQTTDGSVNYKLQWMLALL